MLSPRRGLLKRRQEFSELSDERKIEFRLRWLEWKMVQLLWMSISLSSLAFALFAGWLTHNFIGG